MIKFLINMFGVVASLFCLAGCNFGGPSEEEVIQALDAALRAFNHSLAQENPEVENSYTNAADLIFRNDDASLIHQMSVLVNGDEVSVSGNCVISDYEDYESNYLISGSLGYELHYSESGSPDSGFGVMEGELTLIGGKVETMEFSLSQGEDGELEEFLISANGKDMDLTKQESMYNLFRQISGRLPG